MLLLLALSPAFAQDPIGARKLVDEGVELEDKGDHKGAIKKFDKALKIDQDNLLAMAEKAYSLNSLGQYEQSAAICQDIIEKHNGAKEAPMVYVTYGNNMDQMGRPEASLKVYDKGISVLPYLAMLHFNKGITLSGMGADSSAAAMRCFERSARLDPFHPGTQNAMARLLAREGTSIPTTLALCRFFVLEPEGQRAMENGRLLEQTLTGNTRRTSGGGTEIRVDAGMLRDSTDTVHVVNDFRDQELVWSVTKGMDLANELAKALEGSGLQATITVGGPGTGSGFADKLDMLAGLLRDGRGKNHGFLWEYHADWLIAVDNAGHLPVVARLAYVTKDKDALKWLKEHEREVGDYFAWEQDYSVAELKEKH
ncbi:MAG: tetratricopeptide repeat protein [Flavobacteriales bacterium]|nr:tetratricopeptide repeat protein [Flavobacteriales bacterium]